MSARLVADLGKTRCTVQWRQGGQVLTGVAPGAPGLATPGGVEAALQSLAQATAATGRAAAEDYVCCVASAGALADSAAVEELAQRLRTAHHCVGAVVTSDVVAAHVGAFRGRPGVLLIAGTGAVALAVDATGRIHQEDGLGPADGDLGSGGWIGRRALQLAAEGSAPLARAAAEVLGPAWRSLIGQELPGAAGRRGALVPRVGELAATGERTAYEVLAESARLLATTAAAAVAVMPGEGPVEVAIVGGLRALGDPWWSLLVQELSARSPRARLRAPDADALAGCAMLLERRDLPHERLVCRVETDKARPGARGRGAADDRLVGLALGVLQPGFAGHRMPDWLARAAERGLGAVCYFGHNIVSVDQAAGLSEHLHGAGRVVIGTDEEGGIVSRLGGQGGSRHLGAAMLGRVDDVELTRLVAGRIGLDLREAGIDLDLAPVVDVNSNPGNPVIGVRSFGADPRLVARHGAAFVEGLQQAGVAACAKHFPGHGDTATDSHLGLPRVSVSRAELDARELVPFRAAVDAGVRAVMTAHIVLPAIDPDRPATLSPAVLSLLRDDLGFEGVIVSDALDMGAIRGTVGLEAACAQALRSGCDLLGLGNPVLNRPGESDREILEAAVAAIVAAVRDGSLAEERLAEAAGRVGALHEWVLRSRHTAPATGDAGGSERTVARRALIVRGEVRLATGAVRVLDVRRTRNVASGIRSGPISAELARRGATVTEAFADPAVIEGHPVPHAAPVAGAGEVVADVVVTGAPWGDEAEASVLREAVRRNSAAVVVCTGWVTGGEALPEVANVVFTLGESLPTARAVADLLTGASG